jgi:hypothetical protein
MPLTEEELKAAQEAEMDAALESPSESEPGSSVGGTEVDGPEETVTEAPVEVAPAPETPPVPPEPTEAERLAADNARLREELNEAARRMGMPPPVQAPPLAVAPTPAPATSVPGTPIEFVTADEAESLIDKPQEVLNTLLNKVFQAGREQAMREMPTLVRQQTLSEINLQTKVQKFWSENEDLASYRDFCSMVANQIEVENPGLTFDEVLEKTGEKARERLKLPVKGTAAATEQAPPPAPAPSATPALPKGPGSARKPAPQVTSVDKERQEMVDILF